MKKSSEDESKSKTAPILRTDQIPPALLETLSSLDAALDYMDERGRNEVLRAHRLVYEVMQFIAKGDCDLSQLFTEAAQ